MSSPEIVVHKLAGLGVTYEMLGDMVHDAADDLASRANNGTLYRQVVFLVETCGWSVDEIMNRAKLERDNWLADREPPADESFADFLVESFLDGEPVEGLDFPEEV